MEAQQLVEGLIDSSKSFVAGVDSLRGPLEADIYEATDACWIFQDRELQVKAAFGFRTKHVQLTEAVYGANEQAAEQFELTLSHWQSAAEGTVASAALEVKVCRLRLLHFCDRFVQDHAGDGAALLQLLDMLLASVGHMGAPVIISCPATLETIRALALQIGQHYADLAPPEGSTADPGYQAEHQKPLLQLLLQHVPHVDWAASIFQPAVEDIVPLLPCLIPEVGQETTDSESVGASLQACSILLPQFAWDVAARTLGADDLSQNIIPSLQQLVDTLSAEIAAGLSNGEEVAHVLIKVMVLLVDGQEQLHEPAIKLLLLSVLAISQSQTVQNVIERFEPESSTESSDMTTIHGWAELVWSIKAGPGTYSAAHAVQLVPWDHIVPQLPGRWRLRLLLMLITLSGASLLDSRPHSSAHQTEPAFVAWVWQLLQGPLGRELVHLESEADMQEAHLLCMTQVGQASEARQALWAWLQLQLGISQLQAEALKGNEQAAAEQAGVLLEGMQFFTLPDKLLTHQRAQSLTGILISLVGLTTQLGPAFARTHRTAIARLLAAALHSTDATAHARLFAAARKAVQQQILAGIAAAEAAHPSPNQEAPVPPKDRKHFHHPTKRGSITFPGHAALSAVSDWLTVLVPAMTWAKFPASGLSLVSNLVQLLFCHCEKQSGRPADAAEPESSDIIADAFSLPGQIQACMLSITQSLGRQALQQLWVNLMSSEATDPKSLQWLAVLACWLADRNDQASSKPTPSHQTSAAGDTALERAEAAAPEQGWENVTPEDAAGADSLPGLDQKAEEAIQIQEAAIRIGYGGAALPLWEEFLWRYFRWQTQLEAVVPQDAISSHLVQLSHFYEANSPVLSNLCALLAPLSPDSLPGDSPRFVTNNPEAMRALMQLHPLALTKADATSVSQESPTHAPSPASNPALKRHSPVSAAFLQQTRAQQRELAQELEQMQASLSDAAADPFDSSAASPARRTLSSTSSIGSPRAATSFPELVVKPLSRISKVMDRWADELQVSQARLREVICRRYHSPDLQDVESGDIEDGAHLQSHEAEEYLGDFQAARQAAVQAVMEFVQGASLAPIAKHLFLLDMALPKPTAADSKGKGKAPQQLQGDQVQKGIGLVKALAEVILDGSAPAVTLPHLMGMFGRSAAILLPNAPDAKAEIADLVVEVLRYSHKSVSREAESAILLQAAIQPPQLLDTGQADLLVQCMHTILAAGLHLPSLAVSTLLGCFEVDKLATLLQKQDQQQHRANAEQAPPSSVTLLTLALEALMLPGGTHCGSSLIARLTPVDDPSFFAAGLAVVLSLRNAEARAAGLDPLLQLHAAHVPLHVALEAVSLLTEALKDGSIVGDVPFQLCGYLLNLPSISAHLERRQHQDRLDSQADSHANHVCWTAQIGQNLQDDAGSSLPGGEASLLCTCIDIQESSDDRVAQLLDACCHSILRRLGNGLDGAALTEASTRLLTLILEPVAEHPGLVDWLWSLFLQVLQPFLALAGPVSDGQLVRSFRECWACAPWQHATFHTRSPEAITLLRGHLLDADQAVLEMLPGLNWGFVSSHISSSHGSTQGESGRWAAEAGLLALHLCVIKPAEGLSPWWRQLIWESANSQPGTAHAQTGLVQVLAAADAAILQATLAPHEDDQLPYLLQPLIKYPRLIERHPGSRLLRAAELLTQAAVQRNEPEMSACVAAALKPLHLVAIVRGSSDGGEAEASHRGMSDCWQATAEERSQLVSSAFIPLARLHCSLPLATASALLQPHPSQPAAPGSTSASRWHAPRLSQLANRLHEHPSPAVSSGTSPAHAHIPAADSSDGAGTAEEDAGGRDDSAIGAAQRQAHEAGPLCVLLGLLSQQPQTLMTSQPLPFANSAVPAFEKGSMPLAEGLGIGGDDLGCAAIDQATQAAVREHTASLIQDACLMEGLAFPLCLLRVSAGAYLAKTQPKAAAALHGLLEGVISVLLHKHVRHKGPTSGQAADRGGERNDAQQQQLSMPGSLPLSQETPSGDMPPGNTTILKLAIGALNGLAADDTMHIVQNAAKQGQVLTQILAAEHLRHLCQQRSTQGQEHAAEVLSLAASSSITAAATLSAALWLSVLPWLEDSRAFSSSQDGSTSDVRPVEQLLELLQERVLRLYAGADKPFDPSPAPSVSGSSITGGQQEPSMTERLRGAWKGVRRAADPERPETPPSPSENPFSLDDLNAETSERRRKLPTWGGFKRMLVHGDDFHETNTRGGEPYFSGPVPGSATAQSEKMVIGGYGPQYVQSSPSSQAESASTPFSTSSQQRSRSPSPPRRWGFKSMLARSSAQSSTPQAATPSAASQDDSLTAGSIMQPAASISQPSVPAKESNKFASGLRKAWDRRINQHSSAHDSAHDVAAQLAKQAESDMTVRLGLAAFAVAAYVKMVLCPALSNYIPRTGSMASVGYVTGSPRHSASGGVDRKPSEASMLAIAHHPHRISLRGSKLDEHMMRELDGVLEQRAALDTLEELQHAPMVMTAGFDVDLFFDVMPGLMQSQIPVHAFQAKLQAVLFADSPLIAFMAY